MEQIDQLWKHLSKLQRDNPISYHETIEKLKKDHEKINVESSKHKTSLVALIRCKAEHLGSVYKNFVIKLCSHEKCPYPKDDIEPIRLCLAYERDTNSMLIIANPKILGEIICKDLEKDFLRGVGPFVFGETGYKLSDLKLDVKGCENRGVEVILKTKNEQASGLPDFAKKLSDSNGRKQLNDEMKESLKNVDIFEKLTELTGDRIHEQEGAKYKKKFQDQPEDVVLLPHDKMRNLGIVESDKNKLEWIDDFTAKLDLKGHLSTDGVEIDCEVDKIKVLTSGPTNLNFTEKLKTKLTIDQVDQVKVRFKKKKQFLMISFPK